ncbi:hypothetical protein M407DRAFT_17357 [Tulasnella calospora MUT 4182]|uniref:Cytochrome P450 n=1 Tax=Tulasnella calospora MUT 4182 TaxID=1051891 RepID=A0A0C3QVR3_9AGAM|nr:hypothetical protein M407DRAFT_17357 [Tulasnella calospora MUT 4182]
MSSHPYLLGAACATPLLYLAITKWARPKPIPGIAHYPITSLLGDIPRVTEDMRVYGNIFDDGGFYNAAFKTGAPIWQLFVGPFDKWVGFADAQEMEDVLNRATRTRAVDQSDIMLAAFSGTIPYGMVSLKSDDVWRKHRRVMNPLVTSKYLKSMTPAIAESARALVDLWKSKMQRVKSKGGTCFSCEDDFRYVSIDAITSITLGKSLDTIPHARSIIETSEINVGPYGGATFHLPKLPLYESLRYLFECIGDATTLPAFIAYIKQQTLRYTPTFRKHYKYVIDHIFSFVTEARQAVKEARALNEEYEAKSLVGMVAEKEGLPGHESLHEWELRDEILAYIFAVSTCLGHDTTAAALTWGMKFLTENPRVQEVLHAELVNALADSPESRPVTFDEMMSPETTPYLEAVVSEILRCAKVAAASSKQTTEPLELLGTVIPPGTSIAWCTHIACDNATVDNEAKLRALDPVRSESSRKNGLGGRGLWKTPTDRFEPERWITVDEKTGQSTFNPRAGYSFPFGIGLRSCAGKQLAVLELKIYIATLNLAFFLSEVPKELSSHRAKIQISRVPDQAFVAPIEWN